MTIEEIVAELDELARGGEYGEYTGSELAEGIKELADRIRPPEVKFRELLCDQLPAHHEHLWVMGETRYYCPGRDIQ